MVVRTESKEGKEMKDTFPSPPKERASNIVTWKMDPGMCSPSHVTCTFHVPGNSG